MFSQLAPRLLRNSFSHQNQYTYQKANVIIVNLVKYTAGDSNITQDGTSLDKEIKIIYGSYVISYVISFSTLSEFVSNQSFNNINTFLLNVLG